MPELDFNAFSLELARRVTADQREHAQRAEQMWQAGDVIAALRLRGQAEGLEGARNHHLATVAEMRGPAQMVEPAPLDRALHSIWLHGDWRTLTSHMTIEEREAAADAVQRYSDWLAGQDAELAGEVANLRWWR